MQPPLLSPASVVVSFTVIRAANAAPFWTVLHENHTILRAAGLNTPDGALELVDVEWYTTVEDVREAACVKLLLQLVADAASQDQKIVRTLVWAKKPSLTKAGLRSAGFSRMAALQVWTAPMDLSDDACSVGTIQRWPLTDGLTAERQRSLLELLHDCITDSHDLTSVSRPVPATLWKTWQSLYRPELIAAAVEERNVGLAVLSRDNERHVATLEYVGVGVHWRRHGHGRRLLRAARTPVHSGDLSSLVAYCDRDNIPAMRLYENCGFVAGEIGHIWMRTV